MVTIGYTLRDYLVKQFSDRKVVGYVAGRVKSEDRYIQVSTVLKDDMDIHYEYYQGYVELHLEGEYHKAEHQDFVNQLRQQSSEITSLSWKEWQGKERYRCQINKPTNTWGDVTEAFKTIMDIFDPIIKKMTEFSQKEEVTLKQMSLNDIFNSQMKLSIPDYQRIYCWEEKNVRRLLEDIFHIKQNKRYHLGNIILQKKENTRDIIDGQQRLVTLSLILHELGKEDIQLLEKKFDNKEAISFIAYNRYIIKNYIDKFISNKEDAKQSILKNLIFSVLELKNTSLDLAYTFFSNQNSRGKALTDYELLKSHHLRFIDSEEQAKHLAVRWDNLLLYNENEEGEKNVSKTVGTFLFRLRKWMRKKVWYDNENYKVKTEFEAAPTIADIPPFGENFVFNESIQGGSHFFAYIDHFVFKFKTFKETTAYKASLHLKGESHGWYRDVIQAFLFAYFLKFDTLYLEEALVCISKLISQHRYDNGKTNYHKLLIYAGESEIVLIIDRATSPTFFIAECVERLKCIKQPSEFSGIRNRYKECEKKMINMIFPLIKNNDISEIIKLIE